MASNLPPSAQRIQEILQKYNLNLEVVEFASTTRTSQDAATAIGCTVAQIAKTLIFRGAHSKKPVCIIASGINRVDEKKVERVIGEPIERADADFVRIHTGFAIGGVPPLGYPLERAPLLDETLMNHQILWAAAGTPSAVFSITPHDLITITQGTIADIKQ